MGFLSELMFGQVSGAKVTEVDITGPEEDWNEDSVLLHCYERCASLARGRASMGFLTGDAQWDSQGWLSMSSKEMRKVR
jgi:hypothetical protein